MNWKKARCYEVKIEECRCYEAKIEECRCYEAKIEECRRYEAKIEECRRYEAKIEERRCCETECLSHTPVRTSVRIEDYGGWWLSGHRSSMAEHWRLKPEVSWV